MFRILIAGAPSPNYPNAIRLAGMEPVDSLEVTSADGFDGLVLPGGSDIDPVLYGQEEYACHRINREVDEAQIRLCKLFAQAGKPILGICKGHQVINVCFGGTLNQNIPQEAQHGPDPKHKRPSPRPGDPEPKPQGPRPPMKNIDQAHETTAEEGSWLAQLYGTRFPVNSCHHQAVEQIAAGFIPIQYSLDGVLEGMVHETLPILSVQWHPERMCGDNRRDDTVDGAPVFDYFKRLIAGEVRVR